MTPLFDSLVAEYDYPENEFPFQHEFPFREGHGLVLVGLRRADGTIRHAYRGTGVRRV